MKKQNLITILGVLFFLLLCMVPSGNAQQGTPIQQNPGTPWQVGLNWTFTSASSPSGGFTANGLTYWRILWVPNGTVSACTLSLDSSAGNGSFSTGGILPTSTIGSCASAGQYVTTSQTNPTNFARITPTITGSGSVNVVVFGYTDNPAAGGSSSSIITSPVDGSGNVKMNCEVGCGQGTPGQQPMAGSQPVVIASNQSTIPVSLASAPTTPITAASLPLPTGAATAANQAAPGTAGSPSMQVVSMQGVAGGTAVPVSLASAPTTPTQPSGFSSLIGFQQAVTASAVALSSNSAHSVCVTALPSNTINVYVGPSGVTTSTGLPLQPGQAACWSLSNTNLIYVIASTTGASVSVSGV